MEELIREMQACKILVDKALNEYLPDENLYPSEIFKAMRYSIFAGGKRIRPILVMKTAEMFGLSKEMVLPTACGIEMIHTYSLIHDDLPCMDDDDFRRGKPTCHKIFGEAIALLAGDALLTHAFLVISKNREIKGIDANAVLDVIERISKASGPLGMVSGQVVDILSEGKVIDEKLLYFMDDKKTAELIKGSLWAGARLAGADEKELERMDNFGEKIGLIFQITDDILDVEGDEKAIGKPVGSDIKNKKNTFINVFGIKQSKDIIGSLAQEAKKLLLDFKNNEFLIKLVDFLINRTH
ncbi:polyprenyl synthetase family protein [Thermovenabulum gondwanense]|uniref:Farnesyl diphosphate synthase n=1 Tax=Thermovenabulum gondwanense TaxID=520767 RepID=A0A162MGR7_9FIRM|nr:farnesyl diphosphate synthase [Thermovenabulum gondwanense]KYO65813.1 Farnesyl diphosphate synthase [Thermovenabulum gondwanense]